MDISFLEDRKLIGAMEAQVKCFYIKYSIHFSSNLMNKDNESNKINRLCIWLFEYCWTSSSLPTRRWVYCYYEIYVERIAIRCERNGQECWVIGLLFYESIFKYELTNKYCISEAFFESIRYLGGDRNLIMFMSESVFD